MRLELIEKKALRAVGVALAVVAVVALGLALWSRYRVFSEQKEAELRREYEERMAQLMENEEVVEDMSRLLVRATLGPPDSIRGMGELVEYWYYKDTRHYGEAMLKFERDRLKNLEKLGKNPSPPPGGTGPESW
jgi:hypothetical protein